MKQNIYMLLQELSHDHAEILMDTASLMEVERLKYMVENYKPIFLEFRQSIIIPGVVCQELVRHLVSDNLEKRDKANEALTIIRNNGEIFTVESADFTSEELRKAFADQELLLRLTKVRSIKQQLLITNDRKLSRDAYNLNQIESCRGKQVYVYYLNFNGHLSECECLNLDHDAPFEKETIEKESVKVETEAKYNPNDNEISESVLLAASLFGAGYITGKYGKTIMNNIFNILNRRLSL